MTLGRITDYPHPYELTSLDSVIEHLKHLHLVLSDDASMRISEIPTDFLDLRDTPDTQLSPTKKAYDGHSGKTVRVKTTEDALEFTDFPAVETHATSHEASGSDEVEHNKLLDYEATEHVALPNTMGNVLSDHDLAAHTGLGLFDASSDVDHDNTTNVHQDVNTDATPTFASLTLDTGDIDLTANDREISLAGTGGYLAQFKISAQSMELRNYHGANNTDVVLIASDGGISRSVLQYTGANNYTTIYDPRDASGNALALTTRSIEDFGACTDVTTLDSTTSQHGLCVKLGGGTTNFLRADGTWASPGAGGLTTYFRTYRAAAQAFTTDQDTRVLWDTENYDIGGNATTIFTAPANGYYYLHASVMLNSLLAATAVYIRLRTAGPTVLAQSRISGPASLQTVEVGTQLYLTSGTWVEVTIFHNRGSDINIQVGSTNSWFEGHRLDA